ncbi:serine--tRNA ligase [Candidatus Roizmanbacteria bacterium RIFCSPHIGHO2_12_FULL_41_11]|uniref:Serine--tRNA ligase n=2 Tax=Candidatus Roizmaniibacteriota TaxID=1752723 RepID=A0A1F7J6D6_9BACT|nr:MAG: serine--tRNA ligase [Candidatus Roizmanbacteria bacterium RIFCSPHIGHO2_12_FULL_41_11]OGK51148.1 MAG: serine--tRNA ligase [Candidatus Roizmanbacteria bacterium RIFCSPLOWO2_01_FULL_41_22]
MLSLDYIRQNPTLVKAAAKNKNRQVDIDKILKLDEKRRTLILKIQKLREERNLLAKQKVDDNVINRGKQIKENLKMLEKELTAVEQGLNNLLYEVPNPAANDVAIGTDETDNIVVKKYKEPTIFDFKPLDHLDIGEKLEIIDVSTAGKVSGTRFAYLKNEAVILEFALVQFALKILINEGFIPVIPPVLIKKEITDKLGYWQAGGNEDYYWVHEPQESQGLYLVGTAEHSIVPMHMNEVLLEKDMPKRYVGFSSSFRRESGSYGKDTRGILRVHQFDKVEMVSFVIPENGDKEHDYLLSLEEKLFQALQIPYQVVKMCSEDLGFPAARKYDIEAWIPSQNKYREVTSTSTTTDFQARRLNIKYRKKGETQFVHILNGTAFAIGRTIISILENYQQPDGSVIIPEVLRPYTGFEKIAKKS